MASTQALTLTQVSQSVTDNTSKVRILWTATQTGLSHNDYTLTAYYWVSVNGGAETRYAVSTTLPQYSTKTILDTTITVNHKDNGEGTITVRTELDTGISAGVVRKSATLELDTIPRKSSLTVSNGTLGRSLPLVVIRKSDSFTHTISYKCGSESGTICTKSDDTSISWTPPLTLASQNKTGTSVSITFTITTYSGSTSIGSNTKTITCSIPTSVKPSCKISVVDATGLGDTFGGFVQGMSKFKITVTPTIAYDSPIESYSITANGKTYNSDEVITDIINTSGDLTITATVTDARGRTSSLTSLVCYVVPYSKPKVTSLSVGRCDEDGAENDRGEWVKVTFSGYSSDINACNAMYCTLKYKKTSDVDYTSVSFPEYEWRFQLSNETYMFRADPDAAYDISFTIADTLNSHSKITSVSTGFVLMDWKGSGRGIAVGKMSELDDVFDVNMDLHLRKHMQMGNEQQIRGVSTDGTVKNAFQPQNENGNTVIGYGNYDHQSGNTNVYGHDILFGVSNIADPGTYRPYRRQGDTVSFTGKHALHTAGFVTNSGKDVYFWIPMAVPIIGAPIVTVSSVDGFVLRQSTKYTHGSSTATYITPDSYVADATMFGGIRVKATFSDTTNVTNNDSIGIYWSGTITFS